MSEKWYTPILSNHIYLIITVFGYFLIYLKSQLFWFFEKLSFPSILVVCTFLTDL